MIAATIPSAHSSVNNSARVPDPRVRGDASVVRNGMELPANSATNLSGRQGIRENPPSRGVYAPHQPPRLSRTFTARAFVQVCVLKTGQGSS